MGLSHEKLEKILPLINSAYDGEAHNAFLAVRRCLQSDGLELADVIRAGTVALSKQSHAPPPPRAAQPPVDDTKKRFNDAMNSWEVAFRNRRKRAPQRPSQPTPRPSPARTLKQEGASIPTHIIDAKIKLLKRCETRTSKPYLVVSLEHKVGADIHLYPSLVVWDALAKMIEKYLQGSTEAFITGRASITRPPAAKPRMSPVIAQFELAA